MASGDSNDDLNWRGSSRWSENFIVYTRKTRKKAQKTCNIYGAATTATSTDEKPISAAPTTSPDQTLARTEVKSETVGTISADGVPVAPTSEEHERFAVASSRTPISCSIATTTSPQIAGCHDVEECLKEKKDADSFQGLREDTPHHEQCLSPGKNTDSSYQRQQEQPEHQQHVPSVVKEGYQSYNRVEGSGTETAEMQNIEVPQFPNDNEAPTSEVNLQDRRESSPLFHENYLPNGREVSTAQPPIWNEGNGEDMVSGSPQVPEGNCPINFNGVVKPNAISTLQLPTGDVEQNVGEMMPGSRQASQGNSPVNVNGVVKPLVISSIDDRIRLNLCRATPKYAIKELCKNLQCEVDRVKMVIEQFESKELQSASNDTQISNNNFRNSGNYVGTDGANIGGYSYPQTQRIRSNVVDRRVLMRVNSEMGAMGHQETRPMGLARVNSDMGAARIREPRLYGRQLSVVVENNNRPSEFVEKEKRTPKANQYYRNSEFLLGKDRLPPESNKRLKTSNGRKHNGETEHLGFGFGFDKSKNKLFKSCSSLLRRLMKHKHGWVFNEPVKVEELGLVDYHDIIKHPMDLGTIKTRLSQNRYKSPREFAEDVRLVFHNAMTYNPKGQDVHHMAEQLLQIFEEKWAIIEAEDNSFWKYPLHQDGGFSTPTSRKAVLPSHFAPASAPLYVPAAPQMRTSDRPEKMTSTMMVDPKTHRPHVGRTPVPKKPKAKDPNKRDMTYDEKQRLSNNLQGLPAEKLDAIVQIIKKRNTALSQNDDEIEVDIDSVDAETLWELDRFVTNYKKSLSKNKRKAELALQARTLANQNAALTNSTPPLDVQIESGTAFEKSTALADGKKRGYNVNMSSSSSSSSSDSGSSSSDTDSDSSSGDGSDAGQSPKT